MHDHPRLLHEVLGLLGMALGREIDRLANPPIPDRNGMRAAIWPARTDPDGAMTAEWEINFAPRNKSWHLVLLVTLYT
jgi:hypothetical protein